MKKIWIPVLWLFWSASAAQIVSDRTNELAIKFNDLSINRALPTIEWIYPRLEYTNSQENQVAIQAVVNSKVALKGVLLSLKKEKEGEALDSREIDIDSGAFMVEISKKMRVLEGENWIEIRVETIEGGVVYDFRSVRVGMDAIADAVLIDRKDYALLIATDTYYNFNDLVNPVNDARSIAKELKDRYGFQVEILQDADQDEVMTKLRDYAQLNYKPQDQLLIFFAGHGQYDDVTREGFLIARDSELFNQESYNSYNRIRSNVNNIPCEHIFLVIDACFGGTFDEELTASRGTYEEIDDREYLVRKLSMKTRKYLTSGSKEYVPDGTPGHHSPFAQKMLEALKTNGGEDKILILDDIKGYMERLQTTPRFGGFGDDETNSDFVFVAK